MIYKSSLAEDEVDLESGFLMAPTAVSGKPPEPSLCPRCGESPCVCEEPVTVCPKCSKDPCECVEQQACPKCGKTPCVCGTGHTDYGVTFKATRDQLYKTFPALANLADKSDGQTVTIHVSSTASQGYAPLWLRNAVEEPLSEADVETE